MFRTRWFQWLQIGILIITTAFLVKTLLSNIEKLHLYSFKINSFYLAISLFALIGHYLLACAIWCLILQKLGAKLRFVEAIRLIGLSQLGKYIPGKIWVMLGRISIGRQMGISQTQLLIATAFSDAIGLVTGTLLSLGVVLTDQRLLPSIFLLAFVLIGGMALLHPSIFFRGINLGLKWIKKPQIEKPMTFKTVILIALATAVAWIGSGFAFFLFACAIEPSSWRTLPLFVSGHTLSTLAGFLALISPGGLGVKEGALTHFLTLLYPQYVALVIAVVARVWLIAGEVIFAAIALLLTPRPLKFLQDYIKSLKQKNSQNQDN